MTISTSNGLGDFRKLKLYFETFRTDELRRARNTIMDYAQVVDLAKHCTHFIMNTSLDTIRLDAKDEAPIGSEKPDLSQTTRHILKTYGYLQNEDGKRIQRSRIVIVRKEWIMDCIAERKVLPVREYEIRVVVPTRPRGSFSEVQPPNPPRPRWATSQQPPPSLAAEGSPLGSRRSPPRSSLPAPPSNIPAPSNRNANPHGQLKTNTLPTRPPIPAVDPGIRPATPSAAPPAHSSNKGQSAGAKAETAPAAPIRSSSYNPRPQTLAQDASVRQTERPSMLAREGLQVVPEDWPAQTSIHKPRVPETPPLDPPSMAVAQNTASMSTEAPRPVSSCTPRSAGQQQAGQPPQVEESVDTNGTDLSEIKEEPQSPIMPASRGLPITVWSEIQEDVAEPAQPSLRSTPHQPVLEPAPEPTPLVSQAAAASHSVRSLLREPADGNRGRPTGTKAIVSSSPTQIIKSRPLGVPKRKRVADDAGRGSRKGKERRIERGRLDPLPQHNERPRPIISVPLMSAGATNHPESSATHYPSPVSVQSTPALGGSVEAFPSAPTVQTEAGFLTGIHGIPLSFHWLDTGLSSDIRMNELVKTRSKQVQSLIPFSGGDLITLEEATFIVLPYTKNECPQPSMALREAVRQIVHRTSRFLVSFELIMDSFRQYRFLDPRDYLIDTSKVDWRDLLLENETVASRGTPAVAATDHGVSMVYDMDRGREVDDLYSDLDELDNQSEAGSQYSRDTHQPRVTTREMSRSVSISRDRITSHHEIIEEAGDELYSDDGSDASEGEEEREDDDDDDDIPLSMKRKDDPPEKKRQYKSRDLSTVREADIEDYKSLKYAIERWVNREGPDKIFSHLLFRLDKERSGRLLYKSHWRNYRKLLKREIPGLKGRLPPSVD